MSIKRRVCLQYSVTVDVEAESEDKIQEWLNETTPQEAVKQAKGNYGEEYSEAILYSLPDDTDCAISLIKEMYGKNCILFMKNGETMRGIPIKTDDENTIILRTLNPDVYVNKGDIDSFAIEFSEYGCE